MEIRIVVVVLLLLAQSFGLQAQTIRYIHTDALGSVAVVTDANRNVVERREYEPYGAALTGIKDGPGYAGHVSDAQTGLSYMQQRYYDPQVGVFLSVDPVTAYDKGDMRFFNRYAYASNNPYKFIDPDGREVKYAVGGTVNEAQLRGFLVRMAFSPTGRAEFQQLELSKDSYTFQLDSRTSNWFDQSSNTIYVNPISYTIIKSNGETLAPELIGIHEVSHAAEYDRVGADAFNQAMQPTFSTTTDSNGNTTVKRGISPEEARATQVEKTAAQEIGLPARQNYQDVCRRGDDGC